jgi:hypothetical protein
MAKRKFTYGGYSVFDREMASDLNMRLQIKGMKPNIKKVKGGYEIFI